MSVAFKKGGLDTRFDQLDTLVAQGLPAAADAALREFMREEAQTADLKDALIPRAMDAALQKAGSVLADVRKSIGLECEGEREREQDEIDAEVRRQGGQHVRAAEAVNLTRLRESFDVNELRAIIESARRTSPDAFAEAVAIVKPRLQKMSAGQMGISRSIGGGSPQVVSQAFLLLNELPMLRGLDARARLDAVDRRRDERLRMVMDAAGRIHQRLPDVVTAIEAEAKRQPIGAGPDTTFVVGRYWESLKK